ncbi:probable calcium-binding protein CML48 isoform X2 [Malania oleifera]|uniref:probable calcium-binding protein CML48 isoform X2 n=1 Tax=Malania oleifera TaxID=397392 RepID=UPI0025AE4777|nr:probable calcium-binding protein CML48 isoform X2 [Malania oleifera]
MASHGGHPPDPYAPSAPALPQSHGQEQQQYQHPPPQYGHSYGQVSSSYGYSGFPPGTHPDVIRSFQMVDRDGSGFIDENELQQALSSGYQRFSLRTIRLLMFLFKNPRDSLRIGPKEFAALWSCLGQWHAIFQRFDGDRSGKIDSMELRNALYSLGYAIPPSVLQVLVSKYDDGSGRKGELNFDSFVED